MDDTTSFEFPGYIIRYDTRTALGGVFVTIQSCSVICCVIASISDVQVLIKFVMATVTCRQATFEGVGNIVLKDSPKI